MLYTWLPSKKVFYIQRKSLKTKTSRSLLTRCSLAMLQSFHLPHPSSSLTEATRSESSFQERGRIRGKLAQPSYLFVNLGELLQVILQEGNFLLLGSTASSIVTVQLYTLHQHKGSAEISLQTAHPQPQRHAEEPF